MPGNKLPYLGVGLIIIVLTGLGFCLFTSPSASKVRVEVKVSSLEYVVNNMSKDDRFNFSLSSNDSLPFIQDSALSDTHANELQNHLPLLIFPASRNDHIRMERMIFPPGAAVKLEQITGDPLKLVVMADEDVPQLPLIFNWKVSFQRGLMYNYLKQQYDTVGDIDTRQAPQVFEFRKDISSGKKYYAEFYKPQYWKWPSELYIKSIRFVYNNSMETYPVSSLLQGEIYMYDSKDSISLHKGDILKVTLAKPVALTVEGDSTMLSASFEGDISKVLLGSKSTADMENLIPSNMQIMHTKYPYLIEAFGFLVTLVGVILSLPLFKK
ncbi:hypothetical protein SAMN05518672_101869 [Chitinophaga sp. CF118]|nr:hypothetical protein SAMN05518672_101869 [Chitinophaga sp. CF118]